MPYLTKPVLSFLGLTYAISWAIFIIGKAAGILDSAAGFGGVAFAFMWGPFIAALICAYIFDRERLTDALAVNPKFNRWLLAAWLIPILIAVASVLISALAPGVGLTDWLSGTLAIMPEGQNPNPLNFSVPVFTAVMALNVIMFGPLINGLLLISEELGWRGYLWDKIIDNGFWKASLFTGIVWGLWHAPLIAAGHNYPELSPALAIIVMTVFTTAMCPIIGYVRLKSKSVWGASLFHGTINAVAGATLISLSPAVMPWKGIIGIGGFIALSLSALWVLFALRAQKFAH